MSDNPKDIHTIDCPLCQGHGKVFDMGEYGKCPKCYGLGYIEVDDQAEIDWQADLKHDDFN